MKVIKRNGAEVDFDKEKIVAAMQKANNSGSHKELTDGQITEASGIGRGNTGYGREPDNGVRRVRHRQELCKVPLHALANKKI